MLTKPEIAVCSAVIAMGLVAGAPSAIAQTDAASIKVPFGDLNTSTPAGAKALLHRIHNAAMEACGSDDGISAEARRYEFLPCVNRATTDAVSKVGNPMVTALYQGQNPSDAIVVAKAR